jgi:hypothetical protein
MGAVMIDYTMMQKNYPKQKAALTRAVNSKDPTKIKAAVTKAVREWNQYGGVWPDDWSRWQRALDDAQRYHQPLEDL